MLPSGQSLPVVRISAPRGWVNFGIAELWHNRELLYFLTWRDVKVRYKQTAIGIVWAVVQPLATVLLFTLVFGRLAKMPSDGIPSPLFILAGLVPWNFFANAMTSASNGLATNAHLITKVYFPRLALPISAVLGGVFDFLIALGLLFGAMIVWRMPLDLHIVWLPVFIAFAFMTAVAVGLWLAALNAEFRDVRFILPFLTQFWMFATPVVYPSSELHDRWPALATFASLNPMVGVVDGFRWSLFGLGQPPGAMFAVSVAACAVLLVTGVAFFRRMERTFADVL
jgi:lipopolysaccharide transport system permease protein